MPKPLWKFTAGTLIALSTTYFPQIAMAADTSPILGFWSVVGPGCGDSSYYEIKKSGASGPEELCELISATRKGNRFTLKQRCQGEGMESVSSLVVRLISPKTLKIHGERYQRCTPDWQ